MGKLWVDQSGEVSVKEHNTGASAMVKFHPYSYFSREPPRRVSGAVYSGDGVPKYTISGMWDSHMDYAKVLSVQGDDLETGEFNRLWSKNPPLVDADKIYHFTEMACTLNEPEAGVAPTDSRNRPDQRLMEQQNFPEANAMKVRLEEAQRARRKVREARIAVEGDEGESNTISHKNNCRAKWSRA